MRVVYRYSIEVICDTPGDARYIKGILRDRASYDERVARSLFCSDEPMATEILLADGDKLYHFLIQNVIYIAICNNDLSCDNTTKILQLAQNLLKSLQFEYRPVDPYLSDITTKSDDELRRLFEIMTGISPIKTFDDPTVTRLENRIPRLPSCCYPKRPSSFNDNIFSLEEN